LDVSDTVSMRIRQRTPPEGRQGGQSSSLATPFLSSASLAPAVVPRRIQGPRTISGGCVAAHASCRRLFPSALPTLRLRMRKTVATQRFCFCRALRVEIQNGYVVAFRAKTESASLPAPFCYPCPPATPLSQGHRSPSRVRMRIRIRACA
jgi:hypothetical protein